MSLERPRTLSSSLERERKIKRDDDNSNDHKDSLACFL